MKITDKSGKHGRVVGRVFGRLGCLVLLFLATSLTAAGGDADSVQGRPEDYWTTTAPVRRWYDSYPARFGPLRVESDSYFEVFIQTGPHPDTRRYVGMTRHENPVDVPRCYLWGVRPRWRRTPDEGIERVVEFIRQYDVPALDYWEPFEREEGDLAHLSECPSLRQIEMGWQHKSAAVTDEGLAQLAQLPHLEALRLTGGSSVTDAGLSVLAEMPDLRYLAVGGDLTGEFLENTQALSQIRSLNILGYWIRDEHLKAIGELEQLVHIDLRDCSKVTDQGLSELARLPLLEELELFVCPRITEKGFEHLARFPELRRLKLIAGMSLGPRGDEHLELGLPYLAEAKELTQLEIGVPNVNPLVRLEGLRSLTVYGVSDEDIKTLAQMDNLVHFGVRHMENMTDESMAHIATMEKLRRLSLASIWCLTDEHCRHLQKLPNLREVNLHYLTQTDRFHAARSFSRRRITGFSWLCLTTSSTASRQTN